MSGIAEMLEALRPTWMNRAACFDSPEDFFPAPGESQRAAKAVCAGCPVRDACLDYALRNDLRGIWGGLNEKERRRALAGGNRRPGLRPIAHGTPGGCRAHRRRGEAPCESCRLADLRCQSDYRRRTA